MPCFGSGNRLPRWVRRKRHVPRWARCYGNSRAPRSQSSRGSSESRSVCAAKAARAISLTEARRLFHSLAHAPALVLAVSGGPDSTALLVLAARWRRARKCGPKLFAATVDHGLRPQSKHEARAVSRLARE